MACKPFRLVTDQIGQVKAQFTQECLQPGQAGEGLNQDQVAFYRDRLTGLIGSNAVLPIRRVEDCLVDSHDRLGTRNQQ